MRGIADGVAQQPPVVQVAEARPGGVGRRRVEPEQVVVEHVAQVDHEVGLGRPDLRRDVEQRVSIVP